MVRHSDEEEVVKVANYCNDGLGVGLTRCFQIYHVIDTFSNRESRVGVKVVELTDIT